MIRTHVQLTDCQLKALRHAAAETGKSVAPLIRRASISTSLAEAHSGVRSDMASASRSASTLIFESSVLRLSPSRYHQPRTQLPVARFRRKDGA